ncbi:glucans biosynthesis glucosyltransferase MdoH [Shewanella sedimentimangrovi]|uniref:Glucans biosynthesis glucosyltransferase H n=1 Tax=Shewanella sedimentimangrovi TaxID=2814293 RepID=A0ABX7QX42_9GAMM|nr:glucans biosynthesis glucosyltransferase MdoH [Shewanella sedimentimangrovi]QSX35617.1 glucans biosynthesis glucosyltransferase MdoH [Shewanella sedimentimangrovi]
MTEALLNVSAPALAGDSAMPPERHSPMPPQSLKAFAEGFPRASVAPRGVRSLARRRVLVVGSAIALSAFAIYEMAGVFSVGGITPLEYLVLLLFAVNFCWIALAFCSGVAGFIQLLRHQQDAFAEDAVLTTRTAILMPTYNEAPDRVFAAVETMSLALAERSQGHAFDWFILSDTTDPNVALAEEQAFWLLRQAVDGRARVYYRRRRKNIARKAGNVADFCRRWGASYDHLLVLDADSIMETRTMVSLAARMQADPDSGLIQTIPALINGTTLMARLQQFAARIYGPVIGTGLAWWVQKEGNFWGHNAIIRTQAFMQAAGLPHLSGKPPFGGHILSHDFVEAALIRRAGWSVQIAADLHGSYEECPPSIIDLAVRDRRWCQGNLQHSRVLPAKGLHWINRLHLLTGIMAYLSSPFWLMLILSGLLLALQAHYIRPEYFTDQFSLFPTWPVMDSDRALRLFFITMGVLFGPKIFGLLLLIKDSPTCRALGGRLRVGLSVLVEVILSALIAPIMMLIHCGAVLSILFGRDSGWSPQRRDDGSLPWAALIFRHKWHMVAGALLGYAAWLDSLTLLAWMSPALVGLWLSVPLSAFTSSWGIGAWFKRRRIMATPEEVAQPQLVTKVAERREQYQADLTEIWTIESLLRSPELMELHLAMMDKLPTHTPGGAVEPLDAIARVKVQEAVCRKSLLALLSKQELGYILGNPLLLKQMQNLPEQFVEDDLVSIC